VPRAVVAWSETLALVAALYVGVPWAGLAIDRTVGAPALPDAARWAGVLPIVLGAGGLAWCFSLFIRVGDGTPNPVRPPQRLVTTGPFAWTRNPIIGSHCLALVGEGLAVGSLGAIALVVLIAAPVVAVVRNEETRLAARFGEEYRRYAAAVPRWVPRRPRGQS